MDNIINSMMEAVRQFFIEAIISQMYGFFDMLNERLGSAAEDLATTPMDFGGQVPWNRLMEIVNTAGSAVQIVAGLLLAFFIALELVQMLIEKNNLADLDIFSMLLKWAIKSFIAILIVANAFTIVGAIFELGAMLALSTAADAGEAIGESFNSYEFAIALEELNVGQLFLLMFQIFIVHLFFNIVGIAIFVVVIGRFLEIFMYVAAAPIPLATMANQEYRAMGNNYLKSLAALAFQSFLMIITISVVGTLMLSAVQSITSDGAIGTSLFNVLGYIFLMCFALFKAPSISKSIFNAQ